MSEHKKISTQRLKQVAAIIESYALGDFSPKVNLSTKNDELDGIGQGINFLGDELSEKVVAVQKMQSILESIPDIFLILDLNNKIKYINNRGLEKLGYRAIDLVEQDFSILVPDYNATYFQEINKEIFNNNVCYNFETLIRTSFDIVIPSNCSAGLLTNFKNETEGIIYQIQDITALKESQEQLKKSNEELDNFNLKVSHDLHGPLHSLKGLIDLTKKEPNELYKYTRLLEETIDVLIETVETLYYESKNNKTDTSYTEIDIDKIIQANKTKIQANTEYTKNKFNLEIDDRRNFATISDQNILATIFRNIIQNAYKYRKKDTESQLTITLTDVNNGEGCNIKFSDNGIGIDQRYIDQIFELGKRATEYGQGKGYGLYFVQNAINKLNGTIKVESQLGEGTVFQIFIPNRVTIKAS